MQQLISGVAQFQQQVHPKKKALFEKLASGQSPEVLFITCADSRIDPNLITQTEAGDLFVCRNAGNVVPPYSNDGGGMAASIEFGVAALGVSHIVVCGHSDCGAMKGAMAPEKLDSLPQVKQWLEHCSAAADAVKTKNGEINESHLTQITEENVVLQLQNLKGHPAVAEKLAAGTMQLHGWVYNIGSGEVQVYDPVSETFKVLDDRYAAELVAQLNTSPT